MILGFVGFLLVRVCVTLGCLSTPLCGMNDKKKLVIKALRAPSKTPFQYPTVSRRVSRGIPRYPAVSRGILWYPKLSGEKQLS